MIKGIKFRHIRIKTEKNRFLKIKRKFYSFPELKDFLEKKGYLDAYYSAAYYLNPEKVGPKERKKGISEKEIWLRADLVFDIDIDRKKLNEVVNQGIKEAKKVLRLGKRKGWVLNYIAFSGAKGFHVVFEDPLTYKEAFPEEREEKAKEYREKILKEIKEINIDEKVLVDTRRIIRIPYTFNSKTGLLCFPLDYKDLEMMDKALIEKIKRRKREIRNGTGSSLLKRAMSAASRYATIPAQIGKRFQPSVLFSVSSTIPGSKRHVLILNFHGKRKAGEFIKVLRKKGIPYLFTKNPLSFQVFSPVAMDKEQIMRISKRWSVSDFVAFKKYKHLLFHIKPIKTIKTFEKASPLLWYSKGHSKLFKILSRKLEIPENKMIGREIILRKSKLE